MQLYNKIDSRVLKEKIANDNRPRATISFYKYATIGNPQLFRDHLYIEWSKLEVLGRVHVAHEGINAQISVLTENLEKFKEQIETITFLQNVRLNYAVEDDGKSFFKLKIKNRPKILADGLDDETFDAGKKGQHLQADEWNEMLLKENTVVVDMRNHYESEVGRFEKAIAPDVDTFRGSLDLIDKMLEEYKDKNILMYCTGGIRCEKASAWYKHRGYKNVYQLDGGIIKYAHQVNENKLDNLFKGKNFVFDERMGERISCDIISNCHQCGKPCDEHTNCANVGCNLLFIQCEECKAKMENCCSSECQTIIHLPEEEQILLRKNKNLGHHVFRKGRMQMPLIQHE
ncbi:MAG TPA: rhodanese-related sulfurtransferase [Bacteroidales bacterium]